MKTKIMLIALTLLLSPVVVLGVNYNTVDFK